METTGGLSTEPTSTADATQEDAVPPHQDDSPAQENLGDQEAVHEDFILPDIGEGIVECEIVKWNVKEGDLIAEDQSVVEVMTDKAVVEIPAKHSGVVGTLYYAQGDIAKVHSPLFSLIRKPETGELKGQESAGSEYCEPLAANQNMCHGKSENNSRDNAPVKDDKWPSG
ncbi:MAG TPA: dihydrolipoamide acetyltransferase, partial [Alteromonas australica]|nr:dihydrolipoamide acetyltransferase [Alteromonas australica]